MGITYAGGSITGKTETREYNFLVDTGSTWMTLRQSDIDLLQLAELERVTIDTPTGTIHRRSFKAAGMLEGVALPASCRSPYRWSGTSYCKGWGSWLIW